MLRNHSLVSKGNLGLLYLTAYHALMQSSKAEQIEIAAADIIEARTIIRQMRIQRDSEELRNLQTLLDRTLITLTPEAARVRLKERIE